MVSSAHVRPRLRRLVLVSVFASAVALHLAPIGNGLENEDSWNTVLAADMLLSGDGSMWVNGGSWWRYENLQRLLPTLSFVPRLIVFDLWIPGWHLISVLTMGLVAATLAAWMLSFGVGGATAAVTGIVFAAHPQLVHAVTWLGGTYDLFVTLFVLLAGIAWRAGRARWAAVCCVAALCSKEHGVVVIPWLVLLAVYERREQSTSWRALARKAAPSGVGASVVLGLRAAQILSGGGLAQAGLPIRSLGFDWNAPVRLAQVVAGAVGYPIARGFDLDPVAVGAMVLGAGLLLLIVRGRWSHPLTVTGALIGAAALLPVVFLREGGRPMPVEEILSNGRYVMLTLALVLPPIVIGLLGLAPTSIHERVLALLLLLGIGASAVPAIERAVDPNPMSPVLIDTLDQLEPGSTRVWLLTDTLRDRPFRAAMSRVMARRLGRPISWVQRGSWRVIDRADDAQGPDFHDRYLRTRETAFRPTDVAPDDVVLLATLASGTNAHRVTAIALDRRSPTRTLSWVPAPVRFGEIVSGAGANRRSGANALVFEVFNDRTVSARDPIVPAVISEVDWSTKDVRAIRFQYRGTTRPGDRRRRYTGPYLEFFWTAPGSDAPGPARMVAPLILDGTWRTATLVLSIDPVWQAGTRVTRVGFHPSNYAADIEFGAIELQRGR